MSKHFMLVGFLLLMASFALSWPVPDDYYAGTEGLIGEELKTQLNNIIYRDHYEFDYDELWDVLQYTDEDPNDPSQVILFYTGWSSHEDNHGGAVSEWNREHVWAKSRGDFGTAKGPGTDIHHIRPTDVTVNSKRSNFDFDNTENGTKYYDNDGPTECYYDDDSWMPRVTERGDVARMLFYMAVRYEGYSSDPDLELTDEVQNSKEPIHGKLSILLQWHRDDPVDNWERRRHERCYAMQGNRNPFIDHPEFVEMIWDENGVKQSVYSK